jgi:hypothetical protein
MVFKEHPLHWCQSITIPVYLWLSSSNPSCGVKAGEVADSFGVVGRVESPVGDAYWLVTNGTEFAKGSHDLFTVFTSMTRWLY